MKYIRLLFFSFLFLFVLITTISLFIPFRVRVSRAVNIKASTATIWAEIDDMRNWKEWNPFFANVPPGKIVETDTANGHLNAMEVNGVRIAWKEKAVTERIAEMERKDHKPVINGWRSVSNPGTDSTALQWYMDFNLRWYPWEKFGSLMLERSYGPRMEEGLSNLKKIAETHLSSNN